MTTTPDPNAAVPPSPEGTPAPDADAPPWGDDFDPARAWSLIQGLRGDKANQAAKLTAFEQAEQARKDAEMTELQRANERAEKAERAIADREAADQRAAVISKHGISAADADFLKDVPSDQLDARAQALAARLAAAPKDDGAEALPGKPQPKLTAGHESGEATEPFDPIALADKIHRRLY
jgi:hypothetical protein